MQSILLSHHQDTLKEMTTEIQIKASSTAAQDYHFPWYLTTVSQQQLWDSTTSIENSKSKMSCMHRFQSNSTQEALSINS